MRRVEPQGGVFVNQGAAIVWFAASFPRHSRSNAVASLAAPTPALCPRLRIPPSQPQCSTVPSLQAKVTLLALGHPPSAEKRLGVNGGVQRGASEASFEAKAADDNLAGSGGRGCVTVPCGRCIRRIYSGRRRPSVVRRAEKSEHRLWRRRDFRRQPVDVLRLRQGKRRESPTRRQGRGGLPRLRRPRLWRLRRPVRLPRLPVRRRLRLRLGHLRGLQLRLERMLHILGALPLVVLGAGASADRSTDMARRGRVLPDPASAVVVLALARDEIVEAGQWRSRQPENGACTW